MMKVNFIVAGIPVKNAGANTFANYASAPQGARINSAAASDVFVKSVPAFKGADEVEKIRQDVIDEGADGITSCLTLYATPYAYSRGYKMPKHESFDRCMRDFFLLCCNASSSYAHNKGGVFYPNEEEFVRILEKLWDESSGPQGADLSKYYTKSILRLDEQFRVPYVKQYVKDDMARAMIVYAKDKYDYDIEDRSDIRDFALMIYDDDSARTIKAKISRKENDSILNRSRFSKYSTELASQGGSGAMLSYLLNNQDRFFSKPKSLRSRYVDALPSTSSKKSIYARLRESAYEEPSLMDQIFINELGW